MLLDPVTLDLLPYGSELIRGLDHRFKTEMPASQVEVAMEPVTSLGDLEGGLIAARRVLAAHVGNRARLMVAGVHPTAGLFGQLNSGERYDRLLAEHGETARRQLVSGLHLHVGLKGPAQALAVYNAMRSYLPDIAALAANAPIYDGRETDLASVRPHICGLMPRQGIPPVLTSWDDYARRLNWGITAGRLNNATEWWWELRLHPQVGTLEIRCPDAQTTVAEAAAVGVFALGLAAWLASRHDAGDLPPSSATWQINENRLSAARTGLGGNLVDLETGFAEPARLRILRLIGEISATVQGLGGACALRRAEELARCNGSEQQRKVLAAAGMPGLLEWLSDRFLCVCSR